jgi:hypothetical protein
VSETGTTKYRSCANFPYKVGDDDDPAVLHNLDHSGADAALIQTSVILDAPNGSARGAAR